MKLDVCIPYLRNYSRELEWSIKSLKNTDYNRIYVLGQAPDYPIDAKVITPPTPPMWARISPYNDVLNKLLIACRDETITDDFYLFNDDIYILGNNIDKQIEKDLLLCYNDIYELFDNWLREKYSSEKSVRNSLSEIAKHGGHGNIGSKEGTELQRQDLQGRPLSETSESDGFMPYALQAIETIWNAWGANNASSEPRVQVDSYLHHMAKYETEMRQSESAKLFELWWEGCDVRKTVGSIHELFGGYGRIAERNVAGQDRPEGELYKEKLPMGDETPAKQQQTQEIQYELSGSSPNTKRQVSNGAHGKRKTYSKTLSDDGGSYFCSPRIRKRIWSIFLDNRRKYDGTIYDRGDLKTHIEQRKHNDSYTQMLQRTVDWLEREGYSTKDYTTHTPIIYNKQKLEELILRIMPIVSQGNSMSIRSLYGNVYGVESEYMAIDTKNPKNYQRRTILSTTETSFNGEIGLYIRKRLGEV